MSELIDIIFELLITTFLVFALLPFYFLAVVCLKGNIKIRKFSVMSIAAAFLIFTSFLIYIFLINLVVRQFF
jgi:hypothetical protein